MRAELELELVNLPLNQLPSGLKLLLRHTATDTSPTLESVRTFPNSNEPALLQRTSADIR